MLVTSGIASCVGCRRVFPPNLAWKHQGCEREWVVHMAPVPTVVVHAKEAAGSSQSRHGKYADPERRRKYRREWMRNKRQEARA